MKKFLGLICAAILSVSGFAQSKKNDMSIIKIAEDYCFNVSKLGNCRILFFQDTVKDKYFYGVNLKNIYYIGTTTKKAIILKNTVSSAVLTSIYERLTTKEIEENIERFIKFEDVRYDKTDWFYFAQEIDEVYEGDYKLEFIKKLCPLDPFFESETRVKHYWRKYVNEFYI